jgi:hypothetical protein
VHELQGGRAIGGGIHRVSGALEPAAKEIRDTFLVFYYQQSHSY